MFKREAYKEKVDRLKLKKLLKGRMWEKGCKMRARQSISDS
jgi:hypothetical protein